MSTSLVVNGVTFTFPEVGEKDWGLNVAAWASAVTSGVLQKSGGTFSLTAELDLGASYGIKSTYFKSRSSNIADAEILRLSNTDKIAWRNNANDGNLELSVNTSDEILFDGDPFLVNPMTTAEDIVVGDTGGTPKRLAKGSENDALSIVSGVVAYSPVISRPITGFSSGAGALAGTDTILQAINKLDGNVGTKLATASFTDAAVTGKVITGFTQGAGTVADTDTILEAINKLDGNDAAKITKATGTAKGDLIGFSAAATPAALNVGSNGYSLQADSAQSTGLKWVAGAKGIQVSDSSGAFGRTNVAFGDVTNLSVTITSTGRPIKIDFFPDGSGNSAIFGATAESESQLGGYYKILRDSTEIARGHIFIDGSSSLDYTDSLSVPIGGLSTIDAVAAGTYTYKLQVASMNTSTIRVLYSKMAAYEL